MTLSARACQVFRAKIFYLLFNFWKAYNHKRDTRMIRSTREPLTKINRISVNMAVIILTDYSNLVYNLAKSRGAIPFEKNVQVHIFFNAPVPLSAYFLGNIIGKNPLIFGVRHNTQKVEYVGGVNQSMRQRRIGLCPHLCALAFWSFFKQSYHI
jgi:hypothetical protein